MTTVCRSNYCTGKRKSESSFLIMRSDLVLTIGTTFVYDPAVALIYLVIVDFS
jgi:hypothetical protein